MSQPLSVQGLLSLQSTVLPTQALLVQVSFSVQALPSVHVTVFARKTQAPLLASQLSSVHGLLSLQTVALPWQVPSAQTSPSVHARPSEQLSVLLVAVQPVARSQPVSVQGLLSLQSSAVPVQALLKQMSFSVQASLSVQVALLAKNTQSPLSPSQLSSVQTLPSAHTLALPTQLPSRQPSASVHGLPSVQLKPLGTAVKEQSPLAGAHWLTRQVVSALVSQVTTLARSSTQAPPSQINVPLQALPSSWSAQSSLSAQSQVNGPATHEPAKQLSPVVQASPSLQSAVLSVKVQPTARSHVSSVHGLLSLQGEMGSPSQAEFLHVSPLVQALLSSQLLVVALVSQAPLTGLQKSAVQGLPSSQVVAVPLQFLPLQTSPVVQASPSSQATAVVTSTARHSPLAGTQLVWLQTVSLLVSQVTGLARSKTHALP
jgi:hypothetical protein